MFKIFLTILTLCGVFICSAAYADIVIPMYITAPTGVGQTVGTITASDSRYGLLLTPQLRGLTPGQHGFHVHENPSCADNGMAAGGHLDPHKTGKHLGPYNNAGHLGDLPALFVNKDGTATQQVLAPRLRVSDLEGHSLMIHDGGDNYADTPQKLGGGGPRMVCGVIPQQ